MPRWCHHLCGSWNSESTTSQGQSPPTRRASRSLRGSAGLPVYGAHPHADHQQTGTDTSHRTLGTRPSSSHPPYQWVPHCLKPAIPSPLCTHTRPSHESPPGTRAPTGRGPGKDGAHGEAQAGERVTWLSLVSVLCALIQELPGAAGATGTRASAGLRVPAVASQKQAGLQTLLQGCKLL